MTNIIKYQIDSSLRRYASLKEEECELKLGVSNSDQNKRREKQVTKQKERKERLADKETNSESDNVKTDDESPRQIWTPPPAPRLRPMQFIPDSLNGSYLSLY